MSRSHKHSEPKKHAHPKNKKRLYLMAGGVFAVAFVAFLAIDRQQLPANVRSLPYVVDAYNTRDAALMKGEALLGRKAANIEPAAGAADDGAGYKREDRARLEKLIRNGASDL
jgi:hypothetical protein